ncbi:MAG: DNA polymerase III subunit gamma/tau [Idiomarina sp.]|nr:DNA polymerase III subunit gamma/tau [Idiomarina sp.]
MDYQVLARKWRPHSFAEVVGQQHVLQALSNALTHQRLHHAYLLTGTRGVGKTTIARILAKSLNCEQGISATPCGKCDTCLEIDQGRYVDLLEIDAASRTKVEDTRELLDNVQYRPTRGRYKVYLIDEVHMLSRHSFNALLKTLEEPPEHVKFLLATTDPEKLPVTVLSRCLQFHLRALTREEITRQLGHILTSESLSYDDEALTLLARAAKGSMRDALSLTDQAIAQGDQSVQLDSVRNMLGHIEGRQIVELLDLAVSGDAVATLECLRAMQDKVADIAAVLPELQNALHQIALLQVSADFADTDIFKDMDALQALAKRLPPELVQVLYRLVLEGRRELPHALDSYSAVEMTLLRLLAFRPQDMAVTTEQPSTGAEQATAKTEQVTGAEQATAKTERVTSAEQATAKTEQVASSEPVAVSTEPSVPKEHAVTSHEQPAPVQAAEQTGDHQRAAQPDEASDPSPVASATGSEQHTGDAANVADEPDDRYHAYEPDDDFISPEEQAALAQEQDSIMYQAGQQHDGFRADAAADANPTQVAAQQHQPAPAGSTEASLERLMATREQLLAKKKAPLTVETRFAAEIDKWSASVDNLKATGRLRQILLNSNFNRHDSGYKLTVDEQQRVLCSPQVLNELESLIRQLVGDAGLTLEYGAPQMTPLLIQQAIDSYRADNAMQQIKTDPIVQSLLQRFDASIDESSIKVEP